MSANNSLQIEMHPESGNVTIYPEDCSQYSNRSVSDSSKALRRTSNFLFRSKKERKITPFPLHETPPSLSSPSPGCRQKLADLLFSRPVDNVILAVIIAFSVLTFVSLSLEDIAEDYVTYVEVVELVLLVFFMVELLLKFYAVGMVRSIQVFIKSVWNLFDFLVVMVSLLLAALSLIYASRNFGVLKIGIILRLFRLTVAFRKFGEFQRIKAKRKAESLINGFSVDLVLDRVLSILGTLLQEPLLQAKHNLYEDLAWCIEVIQSDRLSETILTLPKGTAENQLKETELITLVNQYSTVQKTRSGSLRLRRHSSSPTSLRPSVFHVESSIQLDVTQCLSSVETNDFDVFELQRVTNGHGLFTLMHLLFKMKDLFNILEMPIDNFKRFVSRVQSGYNADVPYHNSTHATDVTQTIHYFSNTCGAADLMQITPLETAGMYIATCVHDFEHPGLNNNYLINTQAELAIRYNDKSVLENHHVSASFALTQDESMDIYSSLSSANYTRIREQIINMVLNTDISQHFSTLSQFKNKFITSRAIAGEEKPLCFQMLIHAADISNPSKPWEICFRWTELVMTEFWAQGDKERQEGLTLGYMMDRYTVNVAKSQIGFIDVIVAPTFEALRAEFPALMENCAQLKANRENWEKNVQKYEEDVQIPAPLPEK
jgi:hypothetical protein